MSDQRNSRIESMSSYATDGVESSVWELCWKALLESAVRDNPMEIAEEFHSIDERSIWRGSIVIDQEQFERGSNPKFRTHNQALRRIFSPFAVDREAPNSDCFVLEPLAIERLH